MTVHIKWPSIESFHNIRKATAKYPHILNGNHKVIYRPKVKLHGSNSAIQFLTNDIVPQSRTRTLEGCDNAGFAAWVNENKEALLKAKCLKGHTVFGEWVGPGVNKGCAIHMIEEKIFAVFAILAKTGELEEWDISGMHGSGSFCGPVVDFIVEPKLIEQLMSDILDTVPNVYVLPWHTEEIVVDWNSSSENLEPLVNKLNKDVDAVEKCDPWVKHNFDKEGVGEGLVFYPRSIEHEGRDNFSALGFKAKGEKHKIVKAKAPVVIDPAVAASVAEFVDLVVTEPRLEQGVQEACEGEYELRKIGPFIGFICKDVNKECQAELEASGLNWKQVSKSITQRAREWYISKTEEL